MMKLLRLWYFRRYWEGFVSSLEGVLTSIASQRVVFFLLMHALISHMGACISYGIALSGSMQDDPVKNNMIVQSKLGYFEGNTLHENHTCTYRYLRFMYWAVNVVVSRACTVAYTVDTPYEQADDFVGDRWVWGYCSQIVG